MFNVIQSSFEILYKIVDKLNRKKTEKDRIFCNFRHELRYNQKLIRDGNLFFELKNDALEEIFHNTHLFSNVEVLYSLRYAYNNISIYLEERKDKNYDKKLVPEGIKNLFEISRIEIISFKPGLILNPNYDSSLSNKKKSKFRYEDEINWNKWGTIFGAIVLVFVILAFLGIESIYDINKNQDSQIGIVDVSVSDNPEFPKIDVKVRNSGSKTGFIKESEFKILHAWSLEPLFEPSFEPISKDYNVSIPLNIEEDIPKIKLSQEVGSNSVDRFSFTFGFNQPYLDYRVYHLRLKLYYDEDNKIVESEDFFVFIKSNGQIVGAYFGGVDNETIISNQKIIDEISSLSKDKEFTSHIVKEISRGGFLAP